MNSPIDVVFTWVESDETHRRKVAQYGGKAVENDIEEIAADTRFASVGEIFYSIGSVLKFAPFVRNIFIVTDQQDPHLEEFVTQHFPNTTTRIKIIDHTEIFRGYEQYLPVFNSLAIETMLWRIEGLSERAVYFNDDFSLLRPIEPEYWFEEDKIVLHNTRWRSMAMHRFLNVINPNRSAKQLSLRNVMYNASLIAGEHKRYLRVRHAPYPFLRSVLETFYTEHHDAMISNIEHRFRHPSQYFPLSLCYILAVNSGGRVILRDRPHNILYINSVGHPQEYITEKLQWREEYNPTSACIQSLDMATEQDQKQIMEWLKEIILR